MASTPGSPLNSIHCLLVAQAGASPLWHFTPVHALVLNFSLCDQHGAHPTAHQAERQSGRMQRASAATVRSGADKPVLQSFKPSWTFSLPLTEVSSTRTQGGSR